MSIGTTIKKIRKLKNLTQKQLANMAGISEITIRKYENGERNPKIENIQRIANALEVPISDLLDPGYFYMFRWDENSEPATVEHKTLNELIKDGEDADLLLQYYANLNLTGRLIVLNMLIGIAANPNFKSDQV